MQGNKFYLNLHAFQGRDIFATRLECNFLIVFLKIYQNKFETKVKFIPNLDINRKIALFFRQQNM